MISENAVEIIFYKILIYILIKYNLKNNHYHVSWITLKVVNDLLTIIQEIYPYLNPCSVASI